MPSRKQVKRTASEHRKESYWSPNIPYSEKRKTLTPVTSFTMTLSLRSYI